MAKFVTIDNERFVSESELIKAMVGTCVRYTTTDNIVVDESEAREVETFQRMLMHYFKDQVMLDKFRNDYVRERFINRTI